MLAMRLPFDHPDVVIGPMLCCEQRVVLATADTPLPDREPFSYDDLAEYTLPEFPATPPTLPGEMIDAFSRRTRLRVGDSSVPRRTA